MIEAFTCIKLTRLSLIESHIKCCRYDKSSEKISTDLTLYYFITSWSHRWLHWKVLLWLSEAHHYCQTERNSHTVFKLWEIFCRCDSFKIKINKSMSDRFSAIKKMQICLLCSCSKKTFCESYRAIRQCKASLCAAALIWSLCRFQDFISLMYVVDCHLQFSELFIHFVSFYVEITRFKSIL